LGVREALFVGKGARSRKYLLGVVGGLLPGALIRITGRVVCRGRFFRRKVLHQ
jgi:hypothetical protein